MPDVGFTALLVALSESQYWDVGAMPEFTSCDVAISMSVVELTLVLFD